MANRYFLARAVFKSAVDKKLQFLVCFTVESFVVFNCLKFNDIKCEIDVIKNQSSIFTPKERRNLVAQLIAKLIGILKKEFDTYTGNITLVTQGTINVDM